MAYEHREGSGTLFKNKFKDTDSKPDFKGEIMLNGQLMDIAAWTKQGAKGEFWSLKVSEKRAVKANDFNQKNNDSELPF
jgi:hypothetical protein